MEQQVIPSYLNTHTYTLLHLSIPYCNYVITNSHLSTVSGSNASSVITLLLIVRDGGNEIGVYVWIWELCMAFNKRFCLSLKNYVIVFIIVHVLCV